MEYLGLNLFNNVYRGKKVFITGHTGFKGSWLASFLQYLGAEVTGYALAPPTTPNHFSLLNLSLAQHHVADINQFEELRAALVAAAPDIVFHLAAQSLVRESYRQPLLTYQTNVMGTLHVYEAVRSTPQVKALITITSDKVYKNNEWAWAYRENDPLGGFDLYSSSKACTEILAQSFRSSFFHPKDYGTRHQLLMATARAGNVIGGGDWATDRLVPDLMRAAASNQPAAIRNPLAVRPWQHVLEPLSGYLLLGQHLLKGHQQFAQEWNFGPDDADCITVQEIVNLLHSEWPQVAIVAQPDEHMHEAKLLRVDSSRARLLLGWCPVWDAPTACRHTAAWYKSFYQAGVGLSTEHLSLYIEQARNKQLSWTL